MVKPEDHYKFLKQYYRHERFEGRNEKSWGTDYSKRIANYQYEDLSEYGYSLIGCHESASGKAIIYDTQLNILDAIPRKKSQGEV
ncbi:hypothetical protein ACI0X9_003369 [Cronobacter turicensis]